MTEHESQAPRGGLFAAKGDAAPSPAVGYISAWQLAGKPENASQRHAAGDTDPRLGVSGIDEAVRKNPGPAGGGLPSPLAALITRAIKAKPSTTLATPLMTRGPLEDARRGLPPAMQPVAANGATLIDPQRVLSVPDGPTLDGQRASRSGAKQPDEREKPTAPKLAPPSTNPNAPWAKPVPAPAATPRARRAHRAHRAHRAIGRKQVTVRLEWAQYARLMDRAAGATLQSILTGAVAVYLEAPA